MQMRENSQYVLLPFRTKKDIFFFLKAYFVVNLLVALYTGPSITALLALLIIGAVGMLSAGYAVSGLAILAFYVNYNFGLTYPPPLFGLLKWAVFGALCSRLLFSIVARGLFFNPITYALLAFSVAAVPGVLMTELKLVSAMKLCIFTLGSLSLLNANRVLTPKDQRIVCGTLLSVVVLLLILSAAVYPFPTIKYFRAYEHSFQMFGYYAQVSYYQGALQHSQQLGPVCALIICGASALYMYSRKHALFYLPLIVSCFGFILLTRSRTALVSALVALVVAGLINYLRSRWAATRRFPLPHMQLSGITSHAFMGLSGGLLVALAAFPIVSKFVTRFIFKTGQSFTGGTLLDVVASRFERVMASLQYFQTNPIFGTGFGVSINPRWVAQNQGSLFSAPVEKAFILTGVLEEVGIVGFIAFSILCVVIARTWYREGRHVMLAMFLTFLIVNFGEMAFFSFGGIGMLYWMLLLFMQPIYDWSHATDR